MLGSRVLALSAAVGASAFGVGRVGCRPRESGRAAAPSMGLLDAFYNDGGPSFNPARNFMQITDQRVARASHILLAPGKCPLPLNEAKDLLRSWKAEIADDAEKFAERARTDSHCRSASKGGDLGFVTRGKLSEQFDDVLFNEEPERVYGPLVTQFGLHLIYIHSCREPVSKAEAVLGLPFSFGGQEE